MFAFLTGCYISDARKLKLRKLPHGLCFGIFLAVVEFLVHARKDCSAWRLKVGCWIEEFHEVLMDRKKSLFNSAVNGMQEIVAGNGPETFLNLYMLCHRDRFDFPDIAM